MWVEEGPGIALRWCDVVSRYLPGSAGYDTSTTSAFQMRNMQLNAGTQRTAVTNIMLAAEQIRVDCVQLTTNGRYVVTGSVYGPPQVWDVKVTCNRLVLEPSVWQWK